MPPILDLLRALGDASGWVVAVTVLALGVGALARGHLVPGYVYRREVARGDRAEDAVEASTRTVQQAAAATESATSTALAVADRLPRIERELAALRADDESR